MTKQERIKKYVELMQANVGHYDEEQAHSNADNLLCDLLRELGYGDVVAKYDEVEKWYA